MLEIFLKICLCPQNGLCHDVVSLLLQAEFVRKQKLCPTCYVVMLGCYVIKSKNIINLIWINIYIYILSLILVY